MDKKNGEESFEGKIFQNSKKDEEEKNRITVFAILHDGTSQVDYYGVEEDATWTVCSLIFIWSMNDCMNK